MNKFFWMPFTFSVLCVTMTIARAESRFDHFVTAKGDQLIENGKPFRFISFNIPNLHLVEDNVRFESDDAWRWPDRFEIQDALEAIRQQGGQVVRTYVISVLRTNDGPNVPRHVLGPGQFNEAGFRALDQVLQIANQTGVRVIIPFVDNWIWWGGIQEYAGFRGKPKESFWTDPQVIADFKETLRYVIGRTNTLTGVAYRDDKAILCWETGNELQSPAPWTRQIAAYIKTLDRNHLVMDGYHTTELRKESLEMPEIDIVTTHHYPGGSKSFAELVRENWQKTKGRKPYIVGEFGFVEPAQLAATMDAVIQTGASGALIWSLRPRNRDGGFYAHSEPAGGNKFKAYHWPGFPSGNDYDEIALMSLMQKRAFEIRGLPVPPVQAPAPPHLLPIQDAASISWQGSVGATAYVVERASAQEGPWGIAGELGDETMVFYRPLFADSKAPLGSWYYRVSARNTAGLSKPSNVAGPITVNHRTLVDEMANFAQMTPPQGRVEIKTHDCRQAKEDAHRLAGQMGSTLGYHVNGAIQSAKIFAFFPGGVADFKFSVSVDGRQYVPSPAEKNFYFGGTGDYGYWKPAIYQCKPALAGAHFLKIEYQGETQIGRIEIQYAQ